ncbi:MAG: hypothetical protein M3R29_06225, partial [Verrucomicrobiota bacterium]|nr:hypothetical protein [Verrucomicrobiota bacterium]
MKLLNAPRQPFVGLAIAAAVGIIFADFGWIPKSALPAVGILVLITAIVLLGWPRLILIYLLVSCVFFVLHSFRFQESEGLWLASRLGNRLRVVLATGSVVSEPKVA